MNNNVPKVSIVLPTYNGAKYIRQSIDSCLKQTYENIELIVVDDASSDDTPEIVRSYKDVRLKYIRHEKNRGLPASLNTGFQEAPGEYLSWTSDDNYYAANAVEKMLNYLKNNDCQFVHCSYYRFYNDDQSHSEIIKPPSGKSLKDVNIIGACFLYSKEVMQRVGLYDTDVFLAEDYDYWLRVSKEFSICHLDEALYFYRIHSQSLYESRYYEVKITDFLVRLKNDVTNVQQVTCQYIDLISRQKGGLTVFNRLLAHILYSRRLKSILTDFVKREISFKDAQQKIKKQFFKSLT